MIFDLKVLLCASLTLMATTNGWIFRTKDCSVIDWPSNWEHDSSGPNAGRMTYDLKIYRCDATVERSGNLTSLVKVVGTHLPGKSNSDIQLIRINNSSTFTRIPSNMGNLLPELIGIDFRAELITSVTAEDLKQFPNMTYFSLYVSPIVSLDSNLFKYTKHIQALVIPSNKIVSVGEDLLTNLTDLKWVNFLSNPCLSQYASRPQQLESLKQNLRLRCPQNKTTTTQSPPKQTTAAPPLVTTPQTTKTATRITTIQPVESCKLRCSLNKETDVLKHELIEQGKLIRDLFGIVSEQSHRIYDLEIFNEKIIRAVNVFLA